MHYIKKDIAEALLSKLQPGKVIIVFGSCRVGKTLLILKMLEWLDEPILALNGEHINVHNSLTIKR